MRPSDSNVAHGKAADCLPLLGDATVALCVTSPPYNVGIAYPGGESDAMEWGEYWEGMILPTFKALVPKMIQGGRIAVNWPSYAIAKRPGFAHHHLFAEVARHVLGLTLLTEIDWDQGIGDGLCKWGSYRSPSAPRFNSPVELIQVWAVGSPSRTDRKGKNDITDGEFQTYTNGLWRFNGRKDPGYPATFPPELPERLIKLFTWPEELVVDCFCGSGTTLCAAKRLGRQWWGCDVNNKAVKLARRRIAEIDCLFPAPLASE